MRSKVIVIIAAAVFAVPLAAQTNDPNAELAGRIPGQPVHCIELDRVGSAIVYGPNAVLYRQSGARIWRMAPDDACPSLRYFAHLSYRNIGHRLCVGDLFDVAPPGSAVASGHCRIGSFTPYDKPR